MRKIQMLMFLVMTVIVSIVLIESTMYPKKLDAGEIKKFSSYKELKDYINKNKELMVKFDRLFYFGNVFDVIESGMPERVFSNEALPLTAPRAKGGAGTRYQKGEVAGGPGGPDAKAGTGAPVDFSTTNVQVEGVDEADIIKSDGKYLYVVSGKKNNYT